MITLRKETDADVLGGPVVLPQVNLLPPEIAQAQRFRKVQGGLGAAVVVALAAVAVLYVGASGSASDAQTGLDAAGAEQSTLQSQVAASADVTAVYAQAAAAEAMLVQVMGPEVRYSRLLNDLSLSIPPNVWITTATYTQTSADAAAAAAPAAGAGATPAAVAGGIGTVAFGGVAFVHDDVAVWLEALAAQPGFADAYLQNSTESILGDKKVANWTASVTVTSAALSGRYVQGAS